jgi:MYXO-CTERM domain-containing protein
MAARALRRVLAVATCAAAALSARAARAQPVAGAEIPLAAPVFGPAEGDTVATAAGPHGHLVVYGTPLAVFARLVADDGTVGPSNVVVSRGVENVRAAFNGTNFFVFFGNSTSLPLRFVRLDVDGVPVDAAPVDVPATMSANALRGYFDVACTPAVCAVVFMTGASGASDIFAARVSAAAQVLDAAPIPIAATAAQEIIPSIATDGTSFLVAWVGVPALLARRLAVDGTLPDAAPITLASGATVAGSLYTATPVVAFDGSGNYVVLWDPLLVNLAFTPKALYLQRVSRAGALLDATPVELARGGSTIYIEQLHAIAAVGGQLLAFWMTRDDTSTPEVFHMYARPVGLDGVPLAAAVSLGPESQVTDVALDVTPAGSVLAAWLAQPGAQRVPSLRALRLTAGGQPAAGTPLVLSEALPAEEAPAAAWSAGAWTAVWTEPGLISPAGSAFAARVSPAGTILTGGATNIGSGTSVAHAQVATLGDGLVAVWDSGVDVSAQRLGSDGQPAGAPFAAFSGGTAYFAPAHQLVPLGRDALLVLRPSDLPARWAAVRIHEDGTVAPFDLSPADPAYPPVDSSNQSVPFVVAAPAAGGVAAAAPLLAARYPSSGAATSVATRALLPEGALPPWSAFAAPVGPSLALAAGDGGALLAWASGATAAFLPLTPAGLPAAPSALPLMAAVPAGAPDGIAAADVAVAASAGGWLAGWRYLTGGSGSTAAPIALAGITGSAPTAAALVTPDSTAATIALAPGAATSGQALLVYQRPISGPQGNSRVFARVVSWDGTGLGPMPDGGVAPDGSAGARDASDAGTRADADAATNDAGGPAADGGTDAAATDGGRTTGSSAGCSCAAAAACAPSVEALAAAALALAAHVRRRRRSAR